MTEWKEFPLATRYYVSSDGEVYDRVKKMILKTFIRSGYEYASIFYTDSSAHLAGIHRMVAITFLDKPEEATEVNHKDGNKKNNHLSNLEWVTRSENIRHRIYELGETTPIGAPQKVMCVETGKVYKSHAEAARKTGCNRKSISACIAGKLKHAGGFSWIKV